MTETTGNSAHFASAAFPPQFSRYRTSLHAIALRFANKIRELLAAGRLEPGGRGRIRTFVARKERQIYSLLVLATHPPVPKNHLGRELRVTNLILQQLAAIPCKNTKRTRVKRHQPVHFSSRNSFRPRSPAIFLVELAEGIEPPTL